MAGLGSLSVLGVAALVAVDVGLVYLAVDHVRGEPAGTVQSIPLPTLETPTPTEDTVDEPADEPPGEPAVDPFATGPLLLDSGTDGTVVRAVRGDCSGDAGAAAAVEVSTDAGSSFRDSGIGDLAEVLRVTAEPATGLVVVAAGADCAPVAYTSTDGGESWDDADPGLYWQLDAEQDAALRSPSRPGDPGCRVQTLSPLSPSGARVLCASGELRGTATAGASWVQLGSLPGAVGVSYTSAADAYAIGTTDECPAAVFGTADGGSVWDELACLDGEEPQAVSVAGGTVTALVDGAAQQSTDGGQTWVQP